MSRRWHYRNVPVRCLRRTRGRLIPALSSRLPMPTPMLCRTPTPSADLHSASSSSGWTTKPAECRVLQVQNQRQGALPARRFTATHEPSRTSRKGNRDRRVGRLVTGKKVGNLTLALTGDPGRRACRSSGIQCEIRTGMCPFARMYFVAPPKSSSRKMLCSKAPMTSRPASTSSQWDRIAFPTLRPSSGLRMRFA